MSEGIESPLLTTKEAAAYLRVSETTIYVLAQQGEIKRVQLSRSKRPAVRYHKQDLDDFIRRCREQCA